MRKQFFYKKRFWAALLVAQFLLYYTASHSISIVNAVAYFFNWQKAFHQKLTSIFPFSVGDIFYLILGAWLIILIYKTLRKKERDNALLKILITVNVFYFVYQLLWGMLYFQKPILDNFDDSEPIKTTELKKLSIHYLNSCIKIRASVKEDEFGLFKIESHEKIMLEILKLQHLLPDFAAKSPTNILNIKKSIYGQWMNYSGILGYYNPFTAEAQYNPNIPATQIPVTIAHETAHQLGYAREQEANFVAYLLAEKSKNTELLYSTNLFALRSLLNNLYEKEPLFVEQILNRYSEAMKRDREFDIKFQKDHQGWLENVFATTNDWFLKSNQQDGSITYSYFVELLVKYDRLRQKKESR